MSKGPTALMIYIFTHFYTLDLVHVTHYVLSGQFPTHLVKVVRLIHLIHGKEIKMKPVLQLTLFSSKQKPGGYMYLTLSMTWQKHRSTFTIQMMLMTTTRSHHKTQRKKTGCFSVAFTTISPWTQTHPMMELIG